MQADSASPSDELIEIELNIARVLYFDEHGRRNGHVSDRPPTSSDRQPMESPPLGAEGGNIRLRASAHFRAYQVVCRGPAVGRANTRTSSIFAVIYKGSLNIKRHEARPLVSYMLTSYRHDLHCSERPPPREGRNISGGVSVSWEGRDGLEAYLFNCAKSSSTAASTLRLASFSTRLVPSQVS